MDVTALDEALSSPHNCAIVAKPSKHVPFHRLLLFPPSLSPLLAASLLQHGTCQTLEERAQPGPTTCWDEQSAGVSQGPFSRELRRSKQAPSGLLRYAAVAVSFETFNAMAKSSPVACAKAGPPCVACSLNLRLFFFRLKANHADTLTGLAPASLAKPQLFLSLLSCRRGWVNRRRPHGLDRETCLVSVHVGHV